MKSEPGAVVVLTGPPGSGKTTVAPLIADQFPLSLHLVADHFWEYLRRGWVEPWKPESARQNDVVISALGAAVAAYARGGYTVVVDGIIGPWYIDAFAEAASSDGFELHYVILRPAREVAAGRATARSAGHLVEVEPVQKMYTAFESLGAFEAHVFDNSVLDASATAAHVVAGMEAGCFRLGR
jgi:adenylate kinase family enzyme